MGPRRPPPACGWPPREPEAGLRSVEGSVEGDAASGTSHSCHQPRWRERPTHRVILRFTQGRSVRSLDCSRAGILPSRVSLVRALDRPSRNSLDVRDYADGLRVQD